MLNLPPEIVQLVQGAANQQAALGALLCTYGLAYETMDGDICAMPLYQGMGIGELVEALKNLIKRNTTMAKEKPTIIVQGDHVDYKHVDYQIGDVASGGIGVNITQGRNDVPAEKCTEELFHYIHPSVDDEGEKGRIHREIKRLLTQFSMGEICGFLRDMEKDKRVYVSRAPQERLYEELVRMGMPEGSGFSLANFKKCI